MEHTFVDINHAQSGRIRLHVVQAGPIDGPLIVLLHGFPEFWYGWHQQIDELAAAGFRVWAPDQRGYNLSDKPAGVAAYAIDILAADVIGLIDAAGRKKAVVVGHDWGAAVAWWTAVVYPDRVERLVVLNVPHPVVMKKFASRDWGQLKRSWYIGFFQIPWLPEKLLGWRDHSFLARTLLGTSRRGTFTNDDLEQYKMAWSQPGTLTAMVNWYRAALRKPPSRQKSIRVTVPTLIIWGAKDRFLKREMVPLSLNLCDNGRAVYLETATHWVQHEEAERVNALLKEGTRI